MSQARTLATQEMSAATAGGFISNISVLIGAIGVRRRLNPAIAPPSSKIFTAPNDYAHLAGPPSAMTSSCAWAAEIGRVGLRRAPRFVGPTDRRPRAGKPMALWTNPDNSFWRAKRGTVGDQLTSPPNHSRPTALFSNAD